MRKFFAILLAMAMLVSVMVVPALAGIGEGAGIKGGGESSKQEDAPVVIVEGEGKTFGGAEAVGTEETNGAAFESTWAEETVEQTETAAAETTEGNEEPETEPTLETQETQNADRQEAEEDQKMLHLLSMLVGFLGGALLVVLIMLAYLASKGCIVFPQKSEKKQQEAPRDLHDTPEQGVTKVNPAENVTKRE